MGRGRDRQQVGADQLKVDAPKLGLSEQVYDILRHLIYDRELIVGSKLNIEQLARDLGVSATPVRDAVNRLLVERLVTYEPFHGYSLAPPLSATDLIAMMEVRELLECHSARIGASQASGDELAELSACVADMESHAARLSFSSFKEFDRRDNDFHDLIVRSARNPFLVESYRPIVVRARMARLYYADSAVDAKSVIAEHHEILAGYLTCDGIAAAEALSSHLQAARSRLSAMSAEIARDSEVLAARLRNRKRACLATTNTHSTDSQQCLPTTDISDCKPIQIREW